MRRLLALAPIIALGCSRTAPAPPSVAAPVVAPAEEPVGHELDAARHRIPAKPLAGTYAGRAVTPTVALNGPVLILRVAPEGEGKPATKLEFKLAAPAERLVVRPEQPPGAEVPVLTIESGGSVSQFENGYAMTLELGAPAGDSRPGKLYVALPDAEKSFFAGEFRAMLERDFLQSPPGPQDAPYLAGGVTLPAGSTGALEAGVVGVSGDQVVFEQVQFPIETADAASLSGRNSSATPPRASALVRAGAGKYRYEHTHLPTGRYLIYCRLEGGPAALAFADVGAGGATVDLALDPAKLGSVRVTIPKALGEALVKVVPVDPNPPAGSPDLAEVFDSALKLGAKANTDGVATIERVPAGAYSVRVAGRDEAVTVVAGQTAAVGVK